MLFVRTTSFSSCLVSWFFKYLTKRLFMPIFLMVQKNMKMNNGKRKNEECKQNLIEETISEEERIGLEMRREEEEMSEEDEMSDKDEMSDSDYVESYERQGNPSLRKNFTTTDKNVFISELKKMIGNGEYFEQVMESVKNQLSEQKKTIWQVTFDKDDNCAKSNNMFHYNTELKNKAITPISDDCNTNFVRSYSCSNISSGGNLISQEFLSPFYKDWKILERLLALKVEDIDAFYKNPSNLNVSDPRMIIDTVLNHFKLTKSFEVLKYMHIENMKHNLVKNLDDEVLGLIDPSHVDESFISFFKQFILDLSNMSYTKKLVDRLLAICFELPSQDCLDVLHIVWLICKIYKVEIDGEDLKYYLNGIIPIKKAALKILNVKNDNTKFDKYALVATSEWKPVISYLE